MALYFLQCYGSRSFQYRTRLRLRILYAGDTPGELLDNVLHLVNFRSLFTKYRHHLHIALLFTVLFFDDFGFSSSLIVRFNGEPINFEVATNFSVHSPLR